MPRSLPTSPSASVLTCVDLDAGAPLLSATPGGTWRGLRLSRVLLLAALVGAPGCGFGSRKAPPGPEIDVGEAQRDYSLSKRSAEPRPDGASLSSVGLLEVPPDRAVLRVDVTVKAKDYVAVRKESDAAAREVVARVGAVEGCEVGVEEVGSPTSSGRDRWQGVTALRVDVILTGLDDVESRSARIDACVDALLALAQVDDASMDEVQVRVGPPWFGVDDPGVHRVALLERALIPLREVAALPNPPPQFDAEATRCTSSGQVRVVSRGIGGVGLDVDMSCATRLQADREPGTPAVVAPAAGEVH